MISNIINFVISSHFVLYTYKFEENIANFKENYLSFSVSTYKLSITFSKKKRKK